MSLKILQTLPTPPTHATLTADQGEQTPVGTIHATVRHVSFERRLAIGAVGALLVQPATAAARALAPYAAMVSEAASPRTFETAAAPSLEAAKVGLQGAAQWLASTAAEVHRRRLDVSCFTAPDGNLACAEVAGGGLSSGVIIGLIVGGVVGSVALGLLTCYCCCGGEGDSGSSASRNLQMQAQNNFQAGNVQMNNNIAAANQLVPAGPLAQNW